MTDGQQLFVYAAIRQFYVNCPQHEPAGSPSLVFYDNLYDLVCSVRDEHGSYNYVLANSHNIKDKDGVDTKAEIRLEFRSFYSRHIPSGVRIDVFVNGYTFVQLWIHAKSPGVLHTVQLDGDDLSDDGLLRLCEDVEELAASGTLTDETIESEQRTLKAVAQL